MDRDDVWRGYIECALWSSSCNGQVKDGHEQFCRGEDCDTQLDDLGYTPEDLGAGERVKIMTEIDDLIDYVETHRPEVADHWDADQFGHDFWLTRNGHGAGFWDRGKGELGDWLTALVKPYGSQDLYVGDDGRVYAS